MKLLQQANNGVAQSQPAGGSAHIYMIDDDDADAMLVRWALRQSGGRARLTHASDGLKAIAELMQLSDDESSELPDLILLDLNMPRIGGHEIAMRIKNNERLRQIPTAIMTTSSNPVEKERLSGLVEDFVQKPIELSEYQQTIQRLVQQWCC